MGASESRSQQEADDDGSTPPDYYTILEVDENASADEIKVSQSLASRHYGRITVYFFFGLLFRAVMERNGMAVSDKVIIVTAFVPTSRAHPSSRQEPR